jgi:hypothetical protein
MSFEVETQNLRHQAGIWATAKTGADTTKTSLAFAVGQGDMFGVMAGSMGVSGMYDTWMTDMDNSLTDASYSFDYLDVCLRAIANDFDHTDAASAQSMDQLDKKMEETAYHHG